MVNGLQIFKERFEPFSGQYVLIGGTACDLLLEAAGLPFRATRDLDIVLCIEVLDREFVRRFWQFVHDGQYEIKERAQNQTRCLYRFSKPTMASYPAVIELFSRQPEMFQDLDLTIITPIALDDAQVSLSAILLDDAYYEFINGQKMVMDGISLASTAGIIALKAKAWLDLSERKQKGEHVDEADIRKHKNDVFRMFQIMEPTPLLQVPEQIRQDMTRYLTKMESEEVNLSALGITIATQGDILDRLRRIYCS